MQAARLLAEQGQEVTLCEGTDRLGGQLNLYRDALPDYGNLVDWLARELDRLGVRVELNRLLDAGDVTRRDPGAVVVATGAICAPVWAEQRNPAVPVHDVYEALERDASHWRGDVAVIGGDYVSCHVAKHIAHGGAAVHVVESGAAFAADWEFVGYFTDLELKEMGENVQLHPESTVELIDGTASRSSPAGAGAS